MGIWFHFGRTGLKAGRGLRVRPPFGLVVALGLAMGVVNGAVVLDRVAVVAGKRAIKTSDIERDTRVTSFLNKSPLDLSVATRCKSAERLVNQVMIREEIATGDYDRASDKDAEGMLGQIVKDRFAGSEARLRAELTKYGITEDEVKDALQWQLTVLRFIEERFRPAVTVNDETVKAYYDEHLAELKKQFPKDSRFETLEPEIREQVAGESVDKLFDAWLADKRTEARVVFRQEVFR